jgi:hypothetical protein
MSKADVVKIQQFEVNKRDIDKVKKAFKVKDNVEAIKKALDVASGKIELEGIFEKYRGAKIKKVYA